MITTILNCYRRPQNLEQQIEAIRAQTVQSSEIWLWVNNHQDNECVQNMKLNINKLIWSSHNFKFHGRFTAALLATTPYVALFDDDTIPGKNWFKNCLTTIQLAAKHNIEDPILGSAGVRLHSPKYIDHTRVGWPSKNKLIEMVDLVGHAWFVPHRAIRSLWSYPQISMENGEDIQLSFNAQRAYGAMTLVPSHHPDDQSMWGSLQAEKLGTDDVAMSNGKVIPHAEFFRQRDQIIEKAINLGWNPLYNQKRYVTDVV